MGKKKATKKATKKKTATKKKVAKKKVAKKKKAVPATIAAAREQIRAINRSPEVAYERAEKVLDKWKAKILNIDGVTGVDVGVKVQDDRSTREIAICVHVDRKRSPSEVSAKDRIPAEYDGVPTDVQVHDFKQAFANGAIPEGGARIRPVGFSAAGTLGVGVIGPDGFARYLTCSHVVSPTNHVTVPTPMEDENSVPIGHAQPNESAFTSLLDCALIAPTNPTVKRVGIRGGLHDPSRMRRPRPADMSDEPTVWKVGAVTGFKAGAKIRSINASHTLSNGVPVNGQIRMAWSSGDPFARLGDSGSLVGIDSHAVGVLRAVDDVNKQALACPIVNAAVDLDFAL